MTYRRKLIEVALPLEAINKESAREKSIRHGHPSTLHLWWARRPLAACRAVLWSSMVDDPSEYMPDEASANEERQRLFKILEDLVLWENINNEEVLDKGRLEIARSVARDLGVDVPVGKEAIREFLATKAPPVLDPFAGGGSIPLEAQRLGLRAFASDLNPVAVLINKALIEIPPKFAGMPPVHPPENGDGKEKQKDLWDKKWKGAEGLAEDVRYYGKWMRDEAFKRISHLYPKAKITEEILAERPDLKAQGLKPGDELTVIAWLWTHTVKCPNPACGVQMPLVKSFMISTRKGNEARVEPRINNKKIDFTIKMGATRSNEGTINRNGAICIACGTPVPFNLIRTEGQRGRMNSKLMAIVAEGEKGRIYLPPLDAHDAIAHSAQPIWKPETELTGKAAVNVPLYGLRTHGDLFTNRQLTILGLLSEMVIEVRNLVVRHINVTQPQRSAIYADAIAMYLAFAIDKLSDKSSTLAWWMAVAEKMAPSFSRQALAMVWDYAEMNPFCNVTSNFSASIEWIGKVLEFLPNNSASISVIQRDATSGFSEIQNPITSTDPPYYDNIGYADLSDFFYVWLRYSLGKIFPELFLTVMVPKVPELVATPYRFGGDKKKAETFFENGLHQVFRNIQHVSNQAYPVTIFYAFKQSEGVETNDEEMELIPVNIRRASTGWETMLSGLIESGFEITGTWPMRTERSGGLRNLNQNALASSIVLVCRLRRLDAGSITRREFLAALKRDLAPALRQLQKGSIAPVDLAQAAIGPGMTVFSRSQAVLESDGTPMRVRTALALINQALDEYLTEQEGEYDSDTRWALAWYEQFGHNEAPYGVAETLCTAKNTSVQGLAEAGILEARSGKVHLLRRDELVTDWNPEKDKRLTAWESVQHLIHALDKNGEEAAGALLSHLGGLSETARDLAYRLYTVCERKGWAQDALMYNMLVVAWPRLKELAAWQEPTQKNLL
jgi:putative DNA methylase